MPDLMCTLVWSYSDESIPDRAKEEAQEHFMAARDVAIKVLNPRYEGWNNEFNETIGNMDEYNSWITRKMNEVLEQFNAVWPGKVKLFSDIDEDGDIAGRFKTNDGRTIIMHMGIKPIGDWKF